MVPQFVGNVFQRLKKARVLLGWIIIFATILVFVRFIRNNPNVWWQLKQTSPAVVTLILLGYALMTLVLAVLYKVMTNICKTSVPHGENVLLTMYSSVVNFFGPLQSGPGFRLVYLKKKYRINVAAYIGVSIVYYICFAVVSGIMLLSGLFGWWILLLVALVPAILFVTMPRILTNKVVRKVLPQTLPLRSLGLLLILSVVQVFVVAIIYFIELSSLGNGVSFGQAIVYTGAANFALFVSLTPGALGFRESFLYFSRDLHGIHESTIVAANILDRGVYVLFLAILFVIILAFHGQKKFSQVRAK